MRMKATGVLNNLGTLKQFYGMEIEGDEIRF